MGRHRFTTLREVFEAVKKELIPEMTAQTEVVFDSEDAAEFLKYKNKRTLQNLVSLNRIPHHKRNGKIYFLKSELVAWIKNDSYEHEEAA